MAVSIFREDDGGVGTLDSLCHRLSICDLRFSPEVVGSDLAVQGPSGGCIGTACSEI